MIYTDNVIYQVSLKSVHHIWARRLSWSCYLDYLYKLWFSLPNGLALIGFQRRTRLKIVDDTYNDNNDYGDGSGELKIEDMT